MAIAGCRIDELCEQEFDILYIPFLLTEAGLELFVREGEAVGESVHDSISMSSSFRSSTASS